MAKKEYQIKENAPGSAAVATIESVPMSQFVSKSAAPADFLGESGFEDLSLPPIIKTKGLQPGNVIFGELAGYGVYDDGKKIRSALLTIHVLEGNPSTKKLERIGMRAALPVSAVIGRALGSPQTPGKMPQQTIDEIKAAGWTEGSVIALRYLGTGKERGDKLNAPNLWEIKAKKPSGEVIDAVDTGRKARAK